MGFRFQRRIRILPSVTLNLSKSGGSVSVGPRGLKHTIGRRGSRTTVGIPGTGISHTTIHTKRGDDPGQTKRTSIVTLFITAVLIVMGFIFVLRFIDSMH